MSANTRRQKIEAMLAAEPDDAELRYMLGMEHASAGDDEGAVACFRTLLEKTPTYIPGYHQGGRALHRLGRLGEARDLLQRGIALAVQKSDQHAADEMRELLENLA